MSALHGRVDEAVECCLRGCGAHWRRVASGEWGISAEACDWPLHIGLARRGGLLRAQAEVLAAGVADPVALLQRNRALTLVRFGSTAAGAVWIAGEIPERAATDVAEIDRLLALLVSSADAARGAYATRRRN